ncbi:non-ribosomal peptide synthetase [Nonomuraea sp. KM88]|uniref:non-ribosomal peptide synthetase n=1 Tax=Nonomuraea sp. KM88 TaxID=3457427 RepID=UPI003FCD0557
MTVTTTPPNGPSSADLRSALLARRLRGGRSRTTTIPPCPDDVPIPLSYGQRRLWFLDRLQPGGVEYTVPLMLRLEGPLDHDVLRRALEEIVARHETLRTRYAGGQEGPHQIVDPPGPVPLPLTDAAGRLDQLVAEHLSEPFDLERGPVLRALLLRLAPEEHVLVLAVHHIACDGWSLSILRRELAEIYPALLAGQDSPLPPPRIRYADFAHWQRGRPAGAALDGQAGYWRTRLAGLEPMELPTDRPRPARRDTSGDAVAFTVPAPVAQAVLAMGRQQGATPFTTLLTAVLAVLAVHCGQRDLAVGTPVAGRDRSETEDVVGFFVNTLVLRADLSGDPAFADLLERVRQGVLADFAHQDLPFEQLVDELGVTRDLSRTPFTNVMFVTGEAGPDRTPMGRLSVSELTPPSVSAKFDLTIGMEQAEDGSVSGLIEYATALFDRGRVERLGGHIAQLLSQVAARPRARLSELELLADEERSLLLREWNATAAPYPVACLHELISAQAARTPQAVAVRCGADELTYRELDQRANALAHRLREAGVGLETPVGVLCDRSPLLLPALLAVLKTGGHYVPLDPAYPEERLGWILAEAGAPVLLTTSGYGGRLPGYEGRELFLDERPDESAELPPESPVHPDNLAYIIYTSGSTGRPKGVMISHRGVVHYLSWCRQAYEADRGDGAPVHSSLSFDLTVTGLFLPLMCGTTVTLIPEDEHPIAGLADALSTGRRFSFVKLTPAHLEPLQRCLQDAPDAAAAANYLVVGGEQLTAEALAFWRSNAPGVVVSNEYGHTETSVANVINLLPAAEATSTPVSVGRPIWNTEIYIVDEDLRPVPIGVTGELLAGGVGVARGFVGRPGLTADRYVPNPFGPGRLYRSGDLVRYLADGTLEFVGRRDHQVKVRGYRIELGEIEAAMLSHPAVAEAVVVPCRDGLAGYAAAGPEARVDERALREHLGARLPEYMVPAYLSVLDELPLTANGKIDRAALPAPEAKPAAATAGARPRDALELAVLRAWEESLGQLGIGVTDDFFQLGGHSLLAVSLVDRLSSELGLDVGLASLFRHPTVRGLCEALQAPPAADCLIRMRAGEPDRVPLFLVPPTAGTPFPYLPLVEELDPRLPVYGLQAPGYEGGEQPLDTVEAIAARYVRELPDGPVALAGWSFGGSVAFEMARLLEEAGRQVAGLWVIDSSVLGVDRLEQAPEVETGDALSLFGRTMLDVEPAALAGLSPEEAMSELLSQARTRELVPDAARSEVVARMAAVYLANSRAAARYRCGAVLDTGLHLIRTTERHSEHGRPEVHAVSWESRTRGGFQATEIAANHWNVVEPPHAATLARIIAASLLGKEHR